MTRRLSPMTVRDFIRDEAEILGDIYPVPPDRIDGVLRKTFWSASGMPAHLDADMQGPRPRLFHWLSTSRRDAATQPRLTAPLSSLAWVSRGVSHIYERHGHAMGMKLALDEWGARLERLAMAALEASRLKVKTR